MVELLPWVLSAITIWMNILVGNNHPRAWLLGLSGQALWFVWIVLSKTWGMLPMAIALSIVFWRNHRRWRLNAKPQN
ncbi:hypothetical protein [Hydrogenophaga sp. NFH-34]|uniref:hypothetical protein n=1 Tax=Hydrogenophaga sp. NFH-34 TaxID=2744446 RepID=UPI001F41EC94|nr:hypothetical protein [Hydrogenophaga sp. NFH-34]